jgi:hypothetical protein
MTRNANNSDAGYKPETIAEGRFADAFLQQLLLEPRAADRALERDGWEFAHAVGAEVLGLFANPRKNALKGPGRAVGAGEIFRDDLPENPPRVAAALGEAIFLGLQPGIPLLLARPIAQQVRRNIAALIDKAESPEIDAQKIAMIEAALSARQGAQLGPTERRHLWEIALLSGPLDELERYRQLFDQERVADVTRLVTEPHLKLWSKLPTTLRRVLSAPRTDDENKLVDRRLGDWLDAIRDTGRRIAEPQQERNVAEVANAMAWLELINRRLAADRGARFRLLYITGEVSLLRAGENIDVDWPGAKGRFTPHLLRHTRGFLDEESALGPRRGKVASLGAALTVWLGNFRDETGSKDVWVGNAFDIELSSYMKSLIARQVSSDRDGLRKIGEAWRDVASHLAPLTPSKLERLEQAAHRKDGRLRILFETIRAEVDRELPEVLRRYLGSVAFGRYLLEFPGRPAPRDRPLLVLEKQASPVTEFFRESNRLWCEQQPLPADRFHEYRDRIREAHRDEPGAAEYFIDLAGAWVLAAQGHWRSAAIIARLAIDSAAPSATPSPVEANGREARYLLAYCRRLTAENETDLDDADDLLQKVRNIREAEKPNRDPRNRYDWEPDVVMERIDAEQLGLRLIRAQFAFFGNDDTRRLEAADDLRCVAEAFKTDLIAPIETNRQMYADAEKNYTGDAPEDQPDIRYRDEVRKLLLRRAWHSIFGIELSLLPVDDPHLERLRFAWQKSLDLAGRSMLRPVRPVWRRDVAVRWPKDELPPTGQGELIALCGQLLFGPPSEALVGMTAEERLRDYRRTLNELAEALDPPNSGLQPTRSEINLRRLLVHPFDRARYLGWIAAVRAAMPPSG